MPSIDEAERMMSLILILSDLAEETRMTSTAFRKWVSAWVLHEFPDCPAIASTIYDELYKHKRAARYFSRLELKRDYRDGAEILGVRCEKPLTRILIYHGRYGLA